MAVPAPPGMQPWVREVGRKLAALERGLRAQEQVQTRERRVSQIASAEDAVISPLGITDFWHQLMTAQGPDISGEGNGERVKITVSATCEGWRSDGLAAVGSGLMRATLQEPNPYKVSPLADDGRGIGLKVPFTYGVGSTPTQGLTASYSQVLNLPVGPYTVRSEYLYTQSTANLSVRWSNRTLMIEPF